MLQFSADTAEWWQQGKGCHMRMKDKRSGALGRLRWLPVPWERLSSRILGQALLSNVCGFVIVQERYNGCINNVQPYPGGGMRKAT